MMFRWASLIMLVSVLACGLARQTPQPLQVTQLSFEIQTATPTVSLLFDAPTNTPDPNATATPTATAPATLTPTVTLAPTAVVAAAAPPSQAEAALPPPATPTITPTVQVSAPLQGGEWDFEAGFTRWPNPFGDSCDGSGLANGWQAFTTRDKYGSSCMNQTTWKGNVHSGESAQEITFGFIGNQAGIFKTAPATSGHRYKIEAFMRREFSPTKVEVFLGVDAAGGVDWQAPTVTWFPWREDLDDQWARTEETVTATANNITIFIRGSHAYPEPGGALRLDSISVTDIGL